MRLRVVPVLGVALFAAFQAGCGGGDPLRYEEAMNLMRERTADTVKTSFSASPHFDNQEPKVVESYKKLMDAHVIDCKANPAVGMLCEPGAAGAGITQSGVTDLTMVAGRWVPASIAKIDRTGRSSATAEVRMNFEPSSLFQEFEEAFETIQSPGAMAALSTRKQGKVVRASFQHYEDGWHIENVE